MPFESSPSSLPPTPRQLRDRRLALGYSDGDFASLVGVSPEQLRAIENDVADADVAFLMNMLVSLLELAAAPAKAAPLSYVHEPWPNVAQLAV